MKFKDFFKVGEVFGYFFRKRDPNRPQSFTVRAMHWINRLAILMFLVCLVVIIYKLFIR